MSPVLGPSWAFSSKLGLGVFVFLLNSCAPFPQGWLPVADFGDIPSPGLYINSPGQSINRAYYVDWAQSSVSYPVASDVKKPHVSGKLSGVAYRGSPRESHESFEVLKYALVSVIACELLS